MAIDQPTSAEVQALSISLGLARAGKA